MSCQVIAFSTTDCPACDISKPIVKKVAEQYGINFEDLDPTTEIELAQQYDVALVPTFVLLNNEGQRIESVDGIIDEQMAKSFISLAQQEVQLNHAN